MKKFFLMLIFSFSSACLNAQLKEYVANTKDSYINLREKPSKNAKIIKKLNINANGDGDLFFEKKEGEWYYFQVSYGLKDDPIYGYIHKSQVKLHPKCCIVNSKKGYVYLSAEAKDGTESSIKLENGSYVTKQWEEGNWCVVQYDNFDIGDAPYGYIKKKDLKKAKE